VTRDQLLERIERAWQAFHSSYAGLGEERLLEPGVVEDWSVKDLIAHVAWWEEEALTHLPHILAGGRPPRYSVTYGGIDAFNALMAERKQELSLAEVLAYAEDTHQRLLALLQAAPDDQITTETRFRRRLRLDTYSHYPIHTAMIRRWREGSPPSIAR
jgi:hypothetical protein